MNMINERFATVKQLSKKFKTSEKTIQRYVKKLFPEIVKNGVKTYISKDQIKKIKINLLRNYSLGIKNKDGFVYIIKDIKLNIVKIGASIDVNSRYNSLLTGNINLQLIAFLKSEQYYKVEKNIHNMFEKNRIKREWFNLTEEQINIIIDLFKFNRSIK